MPPAAGVQALVILADDDEIDFLRALVLQRTEAFVVEFHGAEVDVLFQLEAQAQKDTFF